MKKLMIVGLALAGALCAQGVTHHLPYPSGLPFDALRPASGSNPNGYPVRNAGNWPVTANLGDLDGDGLIDAVYCLEQRLLLAVTFTRDALGLPTAAVPRWAIFDPAGDVNKGLWGSERCAVWDLDGDGLDEVAYLARGANGNFHLRVIAGNAPLCTSGCSNQLGSVPQPLWNANSEADIDTYAPGFAFRVRFQSNNNNNIQVSIANVRGLSRAQDIVVNQGQGNEAQVFSWDPTTGLQHLFSAPWRGQETHNPHYFDVTGDGKDDCLTNGVHDFHGCDWTYCAYGVASSLPGFCATANYDHADTIQPMGDINGDGYPELAIVDDYWSKIALGGPVTSCTGTGIALQESALLVHHQRTHTSTNPFPQHGQTVAVGRLIAGPDACGVDGLQVLCAPKGAPYQNGGSPWGSFVMNGQGNILASTLSIANGPTGWVPRNVDWDGDRTTDEVFNTIGGFHTIYRLVPSGSGNCATGSQTSPIAGPWSHRYRWSFVSHHPGPAGHFDQMQQNHIVDFLGDSREEMFIPGASGLFLVYNSATNPNAGRDLSPWRTESYRRRFAGPVDRTVDYQALPTLVSVEVQPTTLGMATLGMTQTYTAIGHYSDGSTADVTPYATWTSGNPGVAAFSGNTLTSVSNGVAMVRATVAGVNNDDAALVQVGGGTKPRILYAGYDDTFLVAGQPSDLRIEVRAVDPQNDLLAVVVTLGGVAFPALLDDGLNGDARAQDGTFTLVVPGLVATSPADFYLEAVAVDFAINLSDTWPYVDIAGGPVVSGLSVFPFPSEQFGTGPFLAGVGILSGTVTQPAGGTVQAVVRVRDPSVLAIATFLAGAALPSPNDSGTGADQLAGDGLWTLSVTIPPNAPAGRYVIEHLGVDALPRISDAYPRLRVH